MAIDWDAEVLAPTMQLFGEGNPTDPADQSKWPLYTMTTGESFRVPDAVFDRAYLSVSTNDDGSDVTTARPILGVRLSHFRIEPQQNNRVYIPSVDLTFVVREVEPDGHGHAKLLLNVSKS